MNDHCQAVEWTKQQVPMAIALGEVRLFVPSFDGITCYPDVFCTEPWSKLAPPTEQMQAHGVKLAFADSYPISEDCRRISFVDGVACVIDSAYRHFYVETGGEFEQYLSARSNKKTVSTLRRKVRKVEEQAASAPWFQVFSSPEEMKEFLPLAAALSRKSYQERLLGNGLPTTLEFQNELIEKSASGKILGYILRIGDTPAAYNLCPIYGGNKVLYDITGYDPAFAEFSPGTVLQYKVIEDLFARKGIDFYDLCTGEGVHKEIFATGSIRCGSIYFFPVVSRIAVVYAVRAALAMITRGAVAVLSMLGLKDRLKKLIRRSA